jgi:hypothetical protein
MKQGSRRWPDKERILWLMTDDAEWDAVGWQRHTVACGRDDISAEIDREGRLMEYLNCGVRTIASVEARDEVSERLAAALKPSRRSKSLWFSRPCPFSSNSPR